MNAKTILGLALGFAAVATAWVLWLTLAQPSTAPRTPALAPAAEPGEPEARETQPTIEAQERAAIEEPPASLTEGSFSGTVTERGGGPVENVTLRLFALQERGASKQTIAETKSNAAGRFRIRPAPEWPPQLQIAAEAEGFVGCSTGITVGQARAIEISRLVAVFGAILDAQTRVPIAGARVSLDDHRATSDPAGRFRIACPVGLERRILVSSANHAESEVTVHLREPRETRVDVFLEAGTRLEALVFDRETGDSIEGAEVRGSASSEPRTRTDVQGRFSLRVRDGQPVSLHVSASGYCAFEWSLQVQGTRSESRIPLLRPGTIEGRVTDEAGKALQGVRLAARSEAHPFARWELTPEDRAKLQLPGFCCYVAPHRPGQPRDASYASSDADGRFEIAVVPDSAPYQVDASLSGYAPATHGPIVVPSPSGRVFLDVLLTRGATIRGRVSCNEAPWQGSVQLKRADGRFLGRGMTDRDGRYEITDVAQGHVVVSLRDGVMPRQGAMRQRAELDVASGKVYEQDFAWREELASISGRVTLASGNPAAKTIVGAQCRTPEGLKHFQTATQADGTYRLEVIGGHIFWVSAGRGAIRCEKDNVAAGATNVDFVLRETGKLRVRFLDATTRQPVVSSNVSLGWKESSAPAFRGVSSRLDHDGIAELELPVGSVDLTVYPNGDPYVPKTARGITVIAPVNAQPVTIELTRGLDLTLRLAKGCELGEQARRSHLLFVIAESQLASIRGPFPQPGSDSNYRIDGIRMWLSDPGLLSQQVHFGNTGTALVRGLVPGRYVLRAFPGDIVFEPAIFDLPAPESRVEVRWKKAGDNGR